MADEWKSKALVAAEQPRDPSPSDLEISRRISREIATEKPREAQPAALPHVGATALLDWELGGRLSTAVRCSTVAAPAHARTSTAVTNYDFITAGSLIVTLT